MAPVVISSDLTEAEAKDQEAFCLATPGATAETKQQPDGKYTVICNIPDEASSGSAGAGAESSETTAGGGSAAGAAAGSGVETAIGSNVGVGAGARGTFNPHYNVYFCALVPGGFFSSDPDDSHVKRSIRTNNPGALNISNWQKTRLGYVGETPDDGHGNKTTIYCAPEYGIAAWYHLLAQRYGYANAGGTFTLGQLAHSYAGQGAGQAAVDAYVNGWGRFSDAPVSATTIFNLQDDDQMLALGHAMFKHESGGTLRINDSQILFAIRNERSGSLPAPPSGH